MGSKYQSKPENNLKIGMDLSSSEGGYTTSLPIYYGLMAIAGCYLFKANS